MEVDFMVLKGLFLSSILFLYSCRESNTKFDWYNVENLILENKNGIIVKDKQPFTGKIFALDDAGDTVQILGYKNGLEHGTWRKFYTPKHLEELRYFENGIKVDTLKKWWPDGKLQLLCCFKNGEYEGALQEWNEQGQLVKEMHYHQGKEDGSQKVFYDNGKIKSNYVIKDGKRIGLLGTKNCVNVSDSIFKK